MIKLLKQLQSWHISHTHRYFAESWPYFRACYRGNFEQNGVQIGTVHAVFQLSSSVKYQWIQNRLVTIRHCSIECFHRICSLPVVVFIMCSTSLSCFYTLNSMRIQKKNLSEFVWWLSLPRHWSTSFCPLVHPSIHLSSLSTRAYTSWCIEEWYFFVLMLSCIKLNICEDIRCRSGSWATAIYKNCIQMACSSA